jgi:hypothetical protein
MEASTNKKPHFLTLAPKTSPAGPQVQRAVALARCPPHRPKVCICSRVLSAEHRQTGRIAPAYRGPGCSSKSPDSADAISGKDKVIYTKSHPPAPCTLPHRLHTISKPSSLIASERANVRFLPRPTCASRRVGSRLLDRHCQADAPSFKLPGVHKILNRFASKSR